MFYDFGPQYYIDMMKAKTASKYVFKGKKYRISIISDVLIRLEYSETGSFSDYPTFLLEIEALVIQYLQYKKTLLY
jgi:hypothetical protein